MRLSTMTALATVWGQVLRQSARICRTTLWAVDITGRIGSDEFALVRHLGTPGKRWKTDLERQLGHGNTVRLMSD